MADVTIYTTPYCGYCHRAKHLLDRKGVAFEEIDVSHIEKRREMWARAPGAMTVPQIFIDGNGIGGCDELHDLEREGRLDALLGVAGAGDTG